MNSQKDLVKGKIIPRNNGGKKRNAPSIKCRHKEVRTPVQSCSDDSDCIPDSNRGVRKDKRNLKSIDSVPKRKNQAESIRFNSRTRPFSQNDVCERINVPFECEKYKGNKLNILAKSASVGMRRSFEDNVDFIPVKLSPKNRKKTPILTPRENSAASVPRTPRETDSGSCRATWDQLLKRESKNSIPDDLLWKPNTCESQRNNGLEHTKGNVGAQKKRVLITNQTKKYNTEESVLNEKQMKKILPTCEIVSDSFPQNDPIQSLDYLIKQLKEKIVKPTDTSNLEKIIIDMENALQKFNNESCTPGKFLNEEKSRSSSLSKGGTSIVNSKSDLSEAVPKLKKSLEESCLFLQSLCIRQKEACIDHTRDKEQLTLQLAESRRLLAIACSKEKEYEVTIGDLRLRLKEAECAQRKTDELERIVSRLRADTQMLNSYKEAVKKLNCRLKEISCDKENLQSKLSLKDLEIEKLKLLLEVKENLKPDSKIKAARRADVDLLSEKTIDLDLELNGEKELLSSSLTSIDVDRGALVCSSQASSSPGQSPSPSHSWTHISSIRPRPEDLKRNVALMFDELKRKTSRVRPPEFPPLEGITPDNSFWSESPEAS